MMTGTGDHAPALPALSIVLPTYNAAQWLPDTLGRLRTAIARANWPGVEIVVVDDGSTDDTASVLQADAGVPALTVVRQENGGRFRAREAGVRAATGELILFIDSRVHAHPDSLRFIAGQFAAHPERRIWNGHVVTATGASPFTRFWDAITFLAWRKYLSHPRLTSYAIDEYDHFPKGTTFFLAPRAMVQEVIASFASAYEDLRFANDDTLMIRPLAERERIYLSPEFSCTYFPRDNARKFFSHSYHRGTVFVDGYYRRGTRFYRPLQVLMVATPLVVLLALTRPRVFAAAVISGSLAVGAGARGAGVPWRNSMALAVLAPFFAGAYGAGIARGLVMRVATRGESDK